MIAPWRKALLCLIGSVAVMAGAYPEAAAAAPAWLAPVNVSEEGRSSLQPQVAVDARGDAITIWSSAEIQATFRPAGGSWQAPLPISEAPEFGSAIEATVAMDPKGDAVAVWSFPYPENTSKFIVQAAFRPSGGAWQPPETISAPGEGSPEVAIDGKGDAIAVWTLWEDGHQAVQAAARPAGGSWQVPVELFSEEGRDAHGPRIVFSQGGEAIASWNVFNGSNSVAQISSKPPHGEWQEPVDVSEAGRSATTPRVAIDTEGNAVAVWERLFECPGCSFNGELIQSVYRPAGGTWQAPVDISESGKKAEGAHVGIDAAGDAVAVWERVGEGPCCVIQAASKPAGAEWQAPVQLSTGVGSAGAPTLAVARDGDAIALWTVLDEREEVHVQAGMEPAGGEWQAPVEISEPDRSALEQQIAYDSRGDAVAVWRSYDDAGFYLIDQATAYDAAGPLLEGLSTPATGTPGQPLSFSVSPLDAWSALGATSWAFGDGTGVTGTSASHAYAAPGAYTVTITSEDALGNTSSTSRKVKISPEPPPKEPPPKEPPPTPLRSFEVLHLRVKPDGAMVLKLKPPGGGGFGACARMVSGVTAPASDDHTAGTPASRRRGGHRQCPAVPSGSPVSFFGEGSAAVPGAGPLTLTIEPHQAALKVLRAKIRWRVFVKITFTPTGGVASSVTKMLERR